MHRWKRLLFSFTQALALSVGVGLAGLPAVAQDAATDRFMKANMPCTGCHTDEHVLAISRTHHGAAGNPGAPTCASCHGASTAHQQNPTGTKPDRTFSKGTKTPPAQQSEACLACHGGSRHLAFWDSGKHAKNDVTCNSCHLVHAPKDRTLKTKGAPISPYTPTQRQLEYETCVGCHKTIRTQLLKPSHHPIVEGKVTCSNCHNPHGALSPAMVRADSVNQLCTSCHSEKRGPYINQHPPVEENCLSCHTSHGSQHTKLLSRKVPNLCQDCHDWTRHPGNPYGSNAGFDPRPPRTAPAAQFVARSCLNCHNQVHGSNAPSLRGQRFTR